MGEIANDMFDGIICQECTSYIGESIGYPRLCNDCNGDNGNNDNTITERELREVFKPEKGWEVPDMKNAKEFVFDYVLKKYPDVIVRVQTGVLKTGGMRPKKKHMKVHSVDLNKKRGLIRSNYVKFGHGWENRLRRTVIRVLEMTKKRLKITY